MDHNPFAWLALLFREDQAIVINKVEQEFACIFAAQLVVTDAMRHPQVSQVLGRLDVADTPAQDCYRLGRVL